MSHYTHLSIEEKEQSRVMLKKYMKRKFNYSRRSVLKYNEQVRN